MIDYYGLDNSFLGKGDINVPSHLGTLHIPIKVVNSCFGNGTGFPETKAKCGFREIRSAQ